MIKLKHTPLTLSENQKKNLLEMCSIMFPGYVLIIFNDDYKMFEGNGEANNPNLLLFFKQGKNAIEIHWFEFVLNQIVDELAWKYTSDIRADVEFEQFRMNLITDIFKGKSVGEEFHVIDYLYYKHFKKLY
jgi:hypothetical protein